MSHLLAPDFQLLAGVCSDAFSGLVVGSVRGSVRPADEPDAAAGVLADTPASPSLAVGQCLVDSLAPVVRLALPHTAPADGKKSVKVARISAGFYLVAYLAEIIFLYLDPPVG